MTSVGVEPDRNASLHCKQHMEEKNSTKKQYKTATIWIIMFLLGLILRLMPSFQSSNRKPEAEKEAVGPYSC